MAKNADWMDETSRQRLEAALNNAISKAENAGRTADLNDIIDYLQRFNAGDLARLKLSGSKLIERVSTGIAARK